MPREKRVQVQAETDTKVDMDLATGFVLVTIVLCSLSLIGAFSAMMAGIVAPSPIVCSDSGETSNSYVTASLLNSLGGAAQVRYYDVFHKSTAKCSGGSVSSAQAITDQCMLNVCDKGPCHSVPIESCLASDKRCQLREAYVVYPGATSSNSIFRLPSLKTPQVRAFSDSCKYGCSNGACISDPVCTDSDMDSNTGKSDPFMKGFTRGLDTTGNYLVEKTDYCEGLNSLATSSVSISKSLAEYSCVNNRVNLSSVPCANGCKDGACLRCPVVTIGKVTFSTGPCGGEFPFYDGGGNYPFNLYISADQKVSFKYKIEVMSKLPKGAITIPSAGTANGQVMVQGTLFDKYINISANDVVVRPDVKFKVTITYGRQSATILHTFPLAIGHYVPPATSTRPTSTSQR